VTVKNENKQVFRILIVSQAEIIMCQKELHRVYELRDLIEDRTSPNAYFQDFDNSIRDESTKKQVWLAREKELQGVDLTSWEFLKNEALPYLVKRNPSGRGWQQLITILNQARAYNYLRSIGCSSVRFIPKATQKGVETPDLEGTLGTLKVLCEVKTINVSDEEALSRRMGTAGTTTNRLEPGFFNKLKSDLIKANQQMDAYCSGTHKKQIAYVVINFDDLLAEYKEDYYQQIDRYLAHNSFPGIEIVFHNQKTCFHKFIAMTSAKVFNE
jgi:hypothetical protein